jgi:hypothetical protein
VRNIFINLIQNLNRAKGLQSYQFVAMDNYHLKEFSPDQKLFAIIENDGKLKIYDTERNLLKQEYVPNLHLSTPCTALKWIKLALGSKVSD